ncbi:glycosyltransferase family 39 protein [Bifidobacterium crudilactis]|jgi:hypothetical protein|uniref:glycosyltransferase family 39 protein n=1 Tax=Bifidobacterium crudilactis TaxID=327277 RepID=UPI002F35698B
MDGVRARMRSRLAHLRTSQVIVGFLVLVLLPATYFGLAQYKFNGSYSVYDEVSHMSYAWSVSHGNLPARGDSLEKVILDDWPCSGQDRSTENSCENGKPSESFAVTQQYNYFHPPVYYFITGWLARGISAVDSDITFMIAARALSIVWMVGGIIALYFSLRSWKIKRFYAYATCALVPFIPVFLNPGTAVTNDAAGLLTAAGAIWVLSQVLLKQRKFLVPAMSIAFMSGYLKGTFTFQFLAIAVALVCAALWRFRAHEWEKGKELCISGVSIGVTSIISLYSFTIIQGFRGNHDAVSVVQGLNTDPVVGSPIGELLRSTMDWTHLASADTLRQGMNSAPGYPVWMGLLTILIVGSVGFLFFQRREGEAQNMMMFTTALGMMLYPTIVNFREFLSSGQMFPYVGERYGISILPLVLCCWALALHNRGGKGANCLALALPVAGCIASFVSLALLPVYAVPS